MKLGELFVQLGVDSGGAFNTLSNFAFKFNNVATLAEKMQKSLENFGGAKSMAEFSQSVLDLAKNLNLSTNNIQGLRRAALVSRADFTSMTSKMAEFEKRRVNFIMGKDSSFLSEYAKYGLTGEDILGSKSPAEVMRKVINALSRVRPERERQALISSAGFSVREMEGWQEYFKNQKKYDEDKNNLTYEQLKQNEQLNESLATLSTKFGDIGRSLQENLMPTIDKIIGKTNDFADAIDKFLKSGALKTWLEKAGDWWKKDGATQQILKGIIHPIDTMKKNWDNLVYHSVGLFDELGLGNTGLGTDIGITAATIPVNPYLSAGMGSFTLTEGVTKGLLNLFDSGTSSRLQFDPKNEKALKGNDLSFAQSFVYSYFRSKGYSDSSARALMGNIMGESGFNPNALGDNGASFGIAQWRGERRKNLEKFARERNMPLNSLLTQLEFMMSEQGESHKISPEILNSLSTLGAVGAIVNRYERSSNREADISKRFNYAQGIKVDDSNILEGRSGKTVSIVYNNNKRVTVNTTPEEASNVVMADNESDTSQFSLGSEY